MQYTHLGRTGLRVSRLCLGTMNFGPQTPENEAFAIMDRALELGINFIDTADGYGQPIKPGLTEEIIGRWFALGGGRREKVVLASKVYGEMSDWPNESKLSARHIKMGCEASLRRLGVDHIDLYQMHHIDRETPWAEIWQAMEQLVQEGKIIYVGSSNFAGWNIAQATEIAKHRNFLGLVSEQSLYNLTARTLELEVIPACLALGMGVIPWSPLSGGFLAGALRNHAEGRRSHMIDRIEQNRSKLEAYESLCDEIGAGPADVGLAWLLANPAVTAPIIGPRTLDQLDSTLKALDVQLSPEIMQRLDAIFPGPGGEAPEAYAW